MFHLSNYIVKFNKNYYCVNSHIQFYKFVLTYRSRQGSSLLRHSYEPRNSYFFSDLATYTQVRDSPPPLRWSRRPGEQMLELEGGRKNHGLHLEAGDLTIMGISPALITLSKPSNWNVIFATTHEPAEQLVRKLLTPCQNLTRIFFSDNGSTAVEVALRDGLPILVQGRNTTHHLY